VYTERRVALCSHNRRQGFPKLGVSGLNTWLTSEPTSGVWTCVSALQGEGHEKGWKGPTSTSRWSWGGNKRQQELAPDPGQSRRGEVPGLLATKEPAPC
jgi:hypothetical protein